MSAPDPTLGVGDPELPDRSPTALVARRIAGRYEIDEWGLDVDLVAMVGRLPALRLAVRVDEPGRIPDGPALLVHHRRLLAADWVLVAIGVGRATGRPVRFTGVPDRTLVLGPLRRLGGVGDDGVDVRGLLRAGNLVSVGLRRDGGRLGAVPTVPGWAVDAAVDAGAPIVPVAVARPRFPGRRPVVRVGEPVAARRHRGARDPDEVVGLVSRRVAELR